MRSAIPLVVAAALLAGCHKSPDKNATSGAARNTRGAQQDTARKPLYPEADAVAIQRALDSTEIAMSDVARDVSQNDDVLRFAAVVSRDHRAIMHLVDSLGVQGRENAISQRIRANGDSIVKGLGNIAIGLNNTYMEEAVKAHRQALQLLDTAVIPSVENPQLKTFLQQVRPTIAAHLQRAMEILSARHREADENHEAWVSGFTNVRPPEPAGPRLLGVPAEPATTPPPPTTTTSQ